MRRGWLDQELSFSRAAAELQRENDPIGRKLRNLVIAREKETGKQIAIRLQGSKEPKLRITIGSLYRAIPELRPARIDDLARMVKPMLDHHETRTRTVVREEIVKDVLPRIEYLEKQGSILKRAVIELKELNDRELTGTVEN